MFNFELSTQLLEVINVIFFVHVAINVGIVLFNASIDANLLRN
jgi:hypothetical protein